MAEKRLVKDSSSFVGRLCQVSGKTSGNIKLKIETDNYGVIECSTDESIAKQMAAHLFDFVRIEGHGLWEKTSGHDWPVVEFTITNFNVIKNIPLSESISEIRNLNLGWEDDPIKYIANLNGESPIL